MIGSMKPPEGGGLHALASKFRSLGLDSEADLQSFLKLVKIREAVSRNQNIVDSVNPPKQLTVLLAGVACLQRRLEDGSRQIYTFQYPGDFCDLHRYVLPELDQAVAVMALTNCLIGIIRHDDMEGTLAQHPNLCLAFWRASMLEASIFREGLLNIGRRAALPRVASIICEQLNRLEAININGTAIPVTQVDLADAAGLSVVHVNRIIQDLRKFGALSKETRSIEVANRQQLVELANFNGRYLNMPNVLSHWKIDTGR